MVIASSCGPGTLSGDAPLHFDDASLDSLLDFAAAAGELTKQAREGLPDPASEPPKFRAWLEEHHDTLDQEKSAFVDHLRENSHLEAWAAALVTELRRRRPEATNAEAIERACTEVESLLHR